MSMGASANRSGLTGRTLGRVPGVGGSVGAGAGGGTAADCVCMLDGESEAQWSKRVAEATARRAAALALRRLEPLLRSLPDSAIAPIDERAEQRLLRRLPATATVRAAAEMGRGIQVTRPRRRG